MKKKDAIEVIRELYDQIDKKTKFIIKVAKDLGKSPQTVRVHWFAQFWSIPEEYQQRVIELLEETIKNQNEPARV